MQHLGRAPPPDEDYSEMICDACMGKNPFLNVYSLADSSGYAAATCKLEGQDVASKDELNSNKATFWPEGWRNRLCRCEKCLVRRF